MTRRINVRCKWDNRKILGTLPWNGVETVRKFSWQHDVNGHPTQEVVILQAYNMLIGDAAEIAYNSGGHDIRVLRKLPEFAEKIDE